MGLFWCLFWVAPTPVYIGGSLGSQLGRGTSPKLVLATRRSPTWIPARNAAESVVLEPDALFPGVWSLGSRQFLFLPIYDLVDLPTLSNVGFRGLESSLTR